MLENESHTHSDESLEDQVQETPSEEKNENADSSGEDQVETQEEEQTSQEEAEKTPVEEKNEPTSEESTADSPEEPQAEETPTDPVSEETPATPQEDEPSVPGEENQVPEEPTKEETKVGEESESLSTDAPIEEVSPAAEEEEPKQEPGEEVELFEGEFDLTVLEKIDAILADKENPGQTLEGVTVEQLILSLQHFFKEENVMAQAGKVGLVKRSFDSWRETTPVPNDLTEAFRKALALYNQKRIAKEKELDVQKSGNAQRKRELLVKLEEIIAAKDPRMIREIREIQDEWKTIGHVPKQIMDEIYKKYRALLDDFYRQRSMHLEMLEYDRKINLQEKEKLIQLAATLVPPEEDRTNPETWKEKMDQFSEIQQQWRSIGHVPREDLERINSEYRTLIDNFFEVRKGFTEQMDTLREENGTKKQAILEKMASFLEFDADKPRAWNEATQELRKFQEEWKDIGAAPSSINGELWHKYRNICNTFFSKKSAYFKKLDETRASNLEKKREMCERAEALKNSTDIEKAAKELKTLQKEWREVGPVPERYSNKLWNRFRSACDEFFEARRTHYNSLHSGEAENLEAKKALIEEVKKLEVGPDGSIDAAIQKLKDIQRRWKEAGKVPYKEKDTIWEAFRKEVDTFFNRLSLKREELKDLRLKASLDIIKDPDKRTRQINTQISKIQRKIQVVQEKVDQYSTNIQFISKGKSGDALREQIQGEIDKEVALIKELKAKIKTMREALKNPPPEEEEKPETPEETPAADVPEEKKEAEDSGTEIAEEVETKSEEAPEAVEESKEEKVPEESGVENTEE